MRNTEKLQQLYDFVEGLYDESGNYRVNRESNYFDYGELKHCFVGQTCRLFEDEMNIEGRGTSAISLAVEKLLGLDSQEAQFLFFRDFLKSNKEDGLARLKHLIEGKSVEDYKGT